MHERFRIAAERISFIAGTPITFSIALSLVVIWAISGPVFGFSDTWQLIINTGTTIVTFLMVFLIQNAQNREAIAVQLKLDELIRAVKGARLGMINIDQLSDADLARLRRQFQAFGEENGGSEELEADVDTNQHLKVKVRTTYDDEGNMESQEVDRTETKRQKTTVKADDDDDDDDAGSGKKPQA